MATYTSKIYQRYEYRIILDEVPYTIISSRDITNVEEPSKFEEEFFDQHNNMVVDFTIMKKLTAIMKKELSKFAKRRHNK